MPIQNELCTTQCGLMSELCAARIALGEMLPEVQAVSSAAYALYEGAQDAVVEAGGRAETAVLEMHWLADAGEPEEAVLGAVSDANRAQIGHIDAILTREAALTDAVHADSARTENAYRAASANIGALGAVCTKGPKDNGTCRADRHYRKGAEQALGWAKDAIDQYRQQQ